MVQVRSEKVVILAGGKGTRISEESVGKPKPMIEIGGHPILWHVMKIYSEHGFRRFVLCLGYKGNMIKEFFYNYGMFNSDITVDTKGGVTVHNSETEDWKITLVDTGQETQTGGRIKRIRRYIEDDPFFCMTYGDGVSDVNITDVIAHHQKQKTLATVTGVRPMARFGALHMENGLVTHFQEKPDTEGGYINGGFFVLSPKVIDYIAADETLWEKEPMEKLANEGQMSAYLHNGFWQPMDTMRDKTLLESLGDSGKEPWKKW